MHCHYLTVNLQLMTKVTVCVTYSIQQIARHTPPTTSLTSDYDITT